MGDKSQPDLDRCASLERMGAPPSPKVRSPDVKAPFLLQPMIDSIVFDLDGTLWDSSASCAVGRNRVLDRHHIPFHPITEHDIRAVTGKSHEECIREVFAGLPEAQLLTLAAEAQLEGNKSGAEPAFRNSTRNPDEDVVSRHLLASDAATEKVAGHPKISASDQLLPAPAAKQTAASCARKVLVPPRLRLLRDP